jgi:hypothetical protein
MGPQTRLPCLALADFVFAKSRIHWSSYFQNLTADECGKQTAHAMIKCDRELTSQSPVRAGARHSCCIRCTPTSSSLFGWVLYSCFFVASWRPTMGGILSHMTPLGAIKGRATRRPPRCNPPSINRLPPLHGFNVLKIFISRNAAKFHFLTTSTAFESKRVRCTRRFYYNLRIIFLHCSSGELRPQDFVPQCSLAVTQGESISG